MSSNSTFSEIICDTNSDFETETKDYFGSNIKNGCNIFLNIKNRKKV